MSFMDDMERKKIYEEMDGKPHRSSEILGKTLGIALFLAIGFASGSIYSTFKTNNDNIISASQNLASATTTSSTLLTSNTSTITSGYIPTSLSDVVSKTVDSVVEITQYTTTNSVYFSSSYTSEGNGSGVIISSDGYILTNNHVISGANKISVRLRNGEEYEATLVGTDSKTDIAVIKIEAENLTVAKIGNSSSALVGDFVLAIGNPLGKLGGTVTYGYISALEREISIEGSTMNLMQIDAAVNPGNSGGGLFNVNGELIGIVSAKSTGYDVEGLGFAIPINDVNEVINDILTHGYATNRPFLGVSLKDSTYSTNNGYYGGIFGMLGGQIQYGATVVSIVEDSAAEKAGIEVGDIIVSIDGNVVSTANEAVSEIANYNVGDKIEIGLIRNNRTKTVTVTLDEYKGQ